MKLYIVKLQTTYFFPSEEGNIDEKKKKNLKDSTNGNPQNSVDIVNSDVEIHKNALATTQSNERNPSRSRSKFLHPPPLVSPFLSPHFTPRVDKRRPHCAIYSHA